MAIARANGMGGCADAVGDMAAALHALCPCRRLIGGGGGSDGSRIGFARTRAGREGAAGGADACTRPVGEAGLHAFGGAGSGTAQRGNGGRSGGACYASEAGRNAGCSRLTHGTERLGGRCRPGRSSSTTRGSGATGKKSGSTLCGQHSAAAGGKRRTADGKAGADCGACAKLGTAADKT